MPKETWIKELKELFYKEYEIESSPENYIHKGLDSSQQFSHLIDFIRTEIEKARKEERGKHAQKINQILNKYSKSISEGGLDYVKAFEAMEDYEHELFKESK